MQIRNLLRLAGPLLAVVLGVDGCAPSREELCAPGEMIRIVVGKVMYTVRDYNLSGVSPVENPPGLSVTQSKNSQGKFTRYCQQKGYSSVRAGAISIDIPARKIGNSRESIEISAPDRVSDWAKPKWRAIWAKDITRFSYEKIEDKESSTSNMTIAIFLRNGERRELNFWCGWTDQPLNGHKGGWIGLCRPILPLADGNFLTVSTGGTPENHPDPIGSDIIYALESAESLIRN